MNSTEACIALNMLPTMGPVRLRKFSKFSKHRNEFSAARRDELRRVEGIGNEVVGTDHELGVALSILRRS